MSDHSPTDAEFWDERYESGRTPWDFGGVPADLREHLAQCGTFGRVLVPGCGTGHDVQALAEAGNETVGIEFSASALDLARKVATHERVTLTQGDCFEHSFPEASFDAIYERTFLCALPPEERERYRDRMHKLLKPGGRLFGYFLYGEEDDPPPYPMDENEAAALLGAAFVRQESRPSQDPLPVFQDMSERWEIWAPKQ